MKLLIVVVLLFLTASAANAYTLVMRDGRRVEIPNEFTVTNSTLTYQAGPTIQITIQLASINIAATERANGEAAGSLLQKASAPKTVAKSGQTRAGSQRSITNKDLEVYRRTRLQSEFAYEKRRKELGLAPVGDPRRQAEEIQERTQQQLLAMRAQDEQAEEYWRSRASSLRTELAANQAQLEFVQHRLDELPPAYSLGAFPFGTLPFQNLVTPFGTSVLTGTGFGINTGVGINTGRAIPRFGVYPGQFRRLHGRGRFTPFGGGNLFAVPSRSFDDTVERTELVNRLNELQMQRAALNVRWREFEEEARRAGAYPGWLRP